MKASLQRECIQSLWIGETLSSMEAVSIQSYLKQGHPFHLYSYGPVANVPEGAQVCDAAEILPHTRIFKYKLHDSYAGFANLFRYHLLFQKGGCWSDLDIFCLRPITLSNEFAFAGDANNRTRGNRLKNYFWPDANNCFMKSPAGSVLCRKAIHFCEEQNVDKLVWGKTGPDLLSSLVRELGFQRYVLPIPAFCLIPYFSWSDFVSTDADIQARRLKEFSHRGVLGIHLWNEMWRRSNVDKNSTFSSDCLYEQLKKQILLLPPSPPVLE